MLFTFLKKLIILREAAKKMILFVANIDFVLSLHKYNGYRSRKYFGSFRDSQGLLIKNARMSMENVYP